LAPAASWAAPGVGGRAAYLLERDTGAVVYSSNAHERLSIASTTKMMTALVAVSHSSIDRIVTVQPYAAGAGETVAGLVPGERLSVGDLIKAMLLPSGGDAAHSLAIDVGGSIDRFVGLMNARARAMHLRDTHYATPVGLDTIGNYSSAADLARIGAAVMADPFLSRTVGLRGARLGDGRTVPNRNDLVGSYGFVNGVKTGHTSGAGFCLVGSGSRDGANLISVVLGESSMSAADADTVSLLRYGLALYHGSRAVVAGRIYARLAVVGAPALRVDLVTKRSLSLVVRRGSHLSVYVTGVPLRVSGPLAPGTRLGEVDVRIAGRLVGRVPLVNRTAVPGPAPSPPPASVPAG
jgi:D-alanyl-D-alanine carboxypeptidase (penicillin-binding protein 5/6)